jgi:hypothetical protein
MYNTYAMTQDAKKKILVSVYGGYSTDYDGDRYHIKDFIANSMDEVIEYYRKNGFNSDVSPEDIMEEGDDQTCYLGVNTAFLEGSSMTDPLSKAEIEEIESHEEGSYHDHHASDIFWRYEYYEISNMGEYYPEKGGLEKMGHGTPVEFSTEMDAQFST